MCGGRVRRARNKGRGRWASEWSAGVHHAERPLRRYWRHRNGVFACARLAGRGGGEGREGLGFDGRRGCGRGRYGKEMGGLEWDE